MNLPNNWYVPILKSKPGEIQALLQLREGGITGFTPVVEIVERPPRADGEGVEEDPPAKPALFPDLARKRKESPSDEAHIRSNLNGLRSALADQPVYIDPHEVASLAEGAGSAIAFAAARDMGLRFIPVVGLSRADRDIRAALSHIEHGLAIRVVGADLGGAGTLGRSAREILKQAGCDWDGVDVLLDAEELPAVESGQTAKVAAMLEFAAGVPWRNLILAGSTIPKSVARFPAEQDTFLPRREWQLWRQLVSRRGDQPIVFGDHGVQHPAGVERPPRQVRGGGPPPIAIRYTDADHWLIARGPARRAGISPTIEYPRVAKRLIGNRDVRWNAFHCPGCLDIGRAADERLQRAGVPETWRRIGAAHHITVATEQLRRERGA